jgi:hypothetical protein
MSKSKSALGAKQIYFQFQVQLTELDHNYPYPSTDKYVSFTIPLDMYDKTRIATVIEKLISECQDGWNDAVATFTAEQAEKLAKEEAEKAGNIELTPA